jgi:predicted Zn-dependent protease
MAEMKNGQAPPEFLSTHPSDDTRIRQIRERLPEAMKYYKP